MALKTSADTPIVTGGNTAVEVIASLEFENGAIRVKVIDTIVTKVMKVCGLTQDAAKTYAESVRENTMTDYNRSHSSGLITYYINCPLAQGTKKTASYAQEGNSRMYTVTITEEVHTCTNSAGW